MPEKTTVLLCKNLARAAIPYSTADGLIDFHSLRSSFVTHLVLDGVNVKVIQHLARHSSIVLTMNCYAKLTSDDIRKGPKRKA